MVDEDMSVKENVKLDEESPRTHRCLDVSCVKLLIEIVWDLSVVNLQKMTRQKEK
jgi:hypothetical protein